MERVSGLSPTILLVEDNHVSAEFARRVLAQSGFAVRVTATVAAGLAAAMAEVPDLILLDVLLPDGDGFALCERMKREPSLSQVPIIFVTSLEDVESRVRGLSIGAVDYMQKPFAAEEIVARVRIHIKIAMQSRRIAEAQSARLEALRDAQRSFNTDPRSLPDARCAVWYESVEEAGGDQYDIVELGEGIYGFLVADIAGHGLEAVFIASALKALFRENASILDSPSDTLHMINSSLKQHLTDGQHITAFYLVLNRKSGIARYSGAGHPPCLAVSRKGKVSRLQSEGDVLGAFPRPQYQTESSAVGPGDRLWLFTDGMLEDFTAGISWKTGLARLEMAVSTCAGHPLEKALAEVRAATLPPGPGADDRILMAVDA